jgi:hypothetical protein
MEENKFSGRALSGRAIRFKSSPENVRGAGFPLLSLTQLTTLIGIFPSNNSVQNFNQGFWKYSSKKDFVNIMLAYSNNLISKNLLDN